MLGVGPHFSSLVVCMAAGPAIEPDDLPSEITRDVPEPSGEGFEAQARAFELGLLRRALHATGWNQRQAAAQLKLSYDQFRHLYRKYHLDGEKP